MKARKIIIFGLALSLVGLTGLYSGSTFAASKLKGKVKVDGSSTVFPITEATAEEFQGVHPKVRVTVGLSGTGGGMKKFTVGETDITGASRPIKDSEREKAKKSGISYIELPVAYDGIAIVIHPKNTWAKSMTVEELKRLWQPNSQIKMWSDLRSSWPKKKVKLYGPGADSGTFEYFTKKIVGKAGATRPDFTASEDDNVLVQGVSGDKHALGYFGYAYYAENKGKLNVVSVDAGKGAVTPSEKTIESGEYKPLSRPVFIYVSKKSARRPEVKAFVDFYLQQAPILVPQVGYVPLKKIIYASASKRFERRMTGTVFGLKELDGEKMEQLLSRKGK